MLHKQGKIFKKFKNSEHIFKAVGLIKSTTFKKILLYNIVKNYLVSRSSTLSSHYFKNQSKLIQAADKENKDIFAWRIKIKVSWITFVFWLPLSPTRLFFVLWEFFSRCEIFFMPWIFFLATNVIISLSMFW